jgi:hypothetical protein
MRASLIVLAAAVAFAQGNRSVDVSVPGNQVWTDTAVDLNAGDSITISASGSVTFQGRENTPDGAQRGWADVIKAYPVNEARRGALIGRIGNTETASLFLIGSRKQFKSPRTGRLFLGVNATSNDSGGGTFQVKIEITAAAVNPKAANISMPTIPAGILNALPKRVVDKDGNKGDAVNFFIIGPEDKLKEAYRNAGWVLVDKTPMEAVLRGLLSTMSKQAYVQMPMSQLMMFGRVQDFGFAHAEPVQVVSTRHHLRIWKSPYEIAGQPLWVGAATHDIGFEKDQRNNGVTHKIDPEIDGERDYLGQTLNETGLVAKMDYITPQTPIREERTATGGTFRTDGRILAMLLASDQAPVAANQAFADRFCSVLKQSNPDGGQWGPCEQYIDGPGRTDLTLKPISKNYRVLIVPGILSSCSMAPAAYENGQDYLIKTFGLTVELLPVPNDSSEDNAKIIAEYLRQHMQDDSRKYIVLGYSKGAPDMMTALATEAGVVPAVAALVTVAGAVGGSPVADMMPEQSIERWLKQLPLGGCKGNLAQGFASLKRGTRRAFLQQYPRPLVPTYSIIAKSDESNTSKMMMQTWQMLTGFRADQDGQLLGNDAIAPGATFLGAAIGDHFAVALPFESKGDAIMKMLVDHGHYPRSALIESLVRYVVEDLENHK